MPRSRLIPFLFFTLASTAFAAVPIPKPPALDARSYVLIDYESGRVLASDQADIQMEPASITKLMTGYLVFVALREKRLGARRSRHHQRTRVEGRRLAHLHAGRNADPGPGAIKGMIVQSGNDATIALAEKLGGTEDAFVQMMNSHATQLGLKNSHFENAWGGPGPAHFMSAQDIATLSRALIREFPEWYKWYSIREFEWNKIKQQNRNGLLARDPSVDGIKTGHTESAGYCLASSAKRGDMRLISVVLGTKSFKAREDASMALLNYGFMFYETVKAKGAGDVVLKPEVYKGEADRVTLVPARDVYVTVGRGTQLKTSATAKEPVIAPIKVGQVLGELTVSDGKDVVARVPLVAKEAVPEGGWWTRMVDGIALWME